MGRFSQLSPDFILKLNELQKLRRKFPDMAGIEAVFVLTKNIKGYVAISARSHSKVNVQRIMEEMGGGGHFNLAAAQVYDQTIEEVCETLTTIIREEIKDS